MTLPKRFIDSQRQFPSKEEVKGCGSRDTEAHSGVISRAASTENGLAVIILRDAHERAR